MKIILLSSRFFPHVGGVEKVISELARNLTDNQIVVVSSLDEISHNPFKIEKEPSTAGSYKLKRIWMNVPRSLAGWLVFPYRFLAGSFGLIRFLKLERPDIVNFHFPDDVSFYLWFSRIFYKTKLIVNLHGNDLHVFSKNRFYRVFIYELLKDSDKIIVNSKYMRSDLLSFFKLDPEKISVIPNGIDLQSIQKIKRGRYIDEEYIFFVGRLVHKKGIDILIKAFNEIRNKKIKLVIEGNGEELANITKLISDFRLTERVILIGGKFSEEEKFTYMKGAMIGVIPSRVEPFGIVALEYLACKTPIIVSRTGGLIDLLEDNKNCLFFNNQDIKDLTSKIDELLENRILRNRISTQGFSYVKNYTWKEISFRYMNVYKSVLIKS